MNFSWQEQEVFPSLFDETDEGYEKHEEERAEIEARRWEEEAPLIDFYC